MYVYDNKLKVFTWMEKIPEQQIKPNSSKKESKEIKSILKTSKNKTTTVQIITPQPIQTIERYFVFPEEQIYKIGKKNIHEVKKFIIKNKLKDSFLHFSIEHIKKLDTINDSLIKPNINKSVYNNPHGLWLSHGTSWLDYVELNIKTPSSWNLFSHIYKIEIYDSVKLITTKDDLFKFIKTYKHKPTDIKFYNIINWTKVKKDWDGVIITPWLGNKIWHSTPNPNDKFEFKGGESAHEFICELMGARWKNNNLILSEWYRSWECASGVIWNVQGISSCDLIKQTDFSKYIS